MNATIDTYRGLHVAETFQFHSSSGPETHTVILWDNGALSCNCRGWIFKRKGCAYRYCKHTFEVMHRLRIRGKTVVQPSSIEEDAMILGTRRTITVED